MRHDDVDVDTTTQKTTTTLRRKNSGCALLRKVKQTKDSTHALIKRFCVKVRIASARDANAADYKRFRPLAEFIQSFVFKSASVCQDDQVSPFPHPGRRRQQRAAVQRLWRRQQKQVPAIGDLLQTFDDDLLEAFNDDLLQTGPCARQRTRVVVVVVWRLHRPVPRRQLRPQLARGPE